MGARAVCANVECVTSLPTRSLSKTRWSERERLSRSYRRCRTLFLRRTPRPLRGAPRAARETGTRTASRAVGSLPAHTVRPVPRHPDAAMTSDQGNCFRFRLYSEDWDELGEYETIVPNWLQGDKFLLADGRRFRI